jgi:hypothetical protein
VHKTTGCLCAELASHRYRLGNRDGGGNFRVVEDFPRGKPEQSAIDARHAIQGPRSAGAGEQGVNLAAVLDNSSNDLARIVPARSPLWIAFSLIGRSDQSIL